MRWIGSRRAPRLPSAQALSKVKNARCEAFPCSRRTHGPTRPRKEKIMAEEHSRRDFMWTATAFSAAMAAGLPQAQAQDGPDQSCAPPKPTGPVAQFKPTDVPVRVRRSAFELDANAVTKLKLAYSKLRALTKSNPKDPRGWMQQASVHCYNCSGGDIEIHNGWWFFPWHRAYLYFHERILAKLADDPNLTLPYWDWNT